MSEQDQDHILNDIGLLSTVHQLMEAQLASKGLLHQKSEAITAHAKNEEAIRSLKVKLGKHTNQMNRPEVILVAGMAAFVPIPPHGYTDFPVDVLFTNPRGSLDK